MPLQRAGWATAAVWLAGGVVVVDLLTIAVSESVAVRGVDRSRPGPGVGAALLSCVTVGSAAALAHRGARGEPRLLAAGLTGTAVSGAVAAVVAHAAPGWLVPATFAATLPAWWLAARLGRVGHLIALLGELGERRTVGHGVLRDPLPPLNWTPGAVVARDALVTAGFEIEPGATQAVGALTAVLLRSPDGVVVAEVVATAVASTEPDGPLGLHTTFEVGPGGAVLDLATQRRDTIPPRPDRIAQCLPHLATAELVAAHRDAVAVLEAAGCRVRTVPPGGAPAAYQASVTRLRSSLLRRPVRAALGRRPHGERGPLAGRADEVASVVERRRSATGP